MDRMQPRTWRCSGSIASRTARCTIARSARSACSPEQTMDNTVDQHVIESIAAAVDRLESETVERLQELIRIPSVTGNEHDAQQAVARQLNDLGLEIDI